MKMILKLLIFGLLSNTITQAFPSEPITVTVSPSDARAKICDKKLSWYRDVTKNTQDMFDKYYNKYKNFKQTNKPNASYLEAEHSEFEKQVTEALDRYQEDAKKIYNISDDTARLAFCLQEVKWFRIMDANLTKSGTNIKTDVLNVLNALGVPKEVIEDFDKVLSRIVNFLFLIDMTKNMFKDVRSLVKEASTKVTDGVALEKKYRLREDGEVVETAQAIDEYDDILEQNDEDKKLNNDVNSVSNDKEIMEAEIERDERVRDRAAEEKVKYDVDEPVEGTVEEPAEIEFRPFVVPI